MGRQPGKKFRTVAIKGKMLERDVEIRVMHDGLFFAEVDGQRYEDKVLTELDKKLKAAVLEAEKLTFKKVIVFELEPHYEGGNNWYDNRRNEKFIRGFSFDFEIWEISNEEKVNNYEGRHRVGREWVPDNKGNLVPKEEFKQKYWKDEVNRCIDFTEERYQKLLKFREAIIKLYEQLHEVLGDGAAGKLATLLDGDKTLMLAGMKA